MTVPFHYDIIKKPLVYTSTLFTMISLKKACTYLYQFQNNIIKKTPDMCLFLLHYDSTKNILNLTVHSSL